jgi:phage I-like protein
MLNNSAFAALSLSITNKQEFRIIPAGHFSAVDGRPVGGVWSMTADMGAKMVATAQSRQIDYVIDYEHQTMLSETNGKPAPAAGWFKNLAWRNDGLYVIDARWTAQAKVMLDSEQYRFISPTFLYDKRTFEINGLLNISLTNVPALHGLTDLALLKIDNALPVANNFPPDWTERQIENFVRVFGEPSNLALLKVETSLPLDHKFPSGWTEQQMENFVRTFGDPSNF